jgi:hypothetical protein
MEPGTKLNLVGVDDWCELPKDHGKYHDPHTHDIQPETRLDAFVYGLMLGGFFGVLLTILIMHFGGIL